MSFPPREGLPPSFAVNAGFVARPDPPGIARPAPHLGEHTDEILLEAGLAVDEIAVLREAGAI
jgi:crotonobetainyl-CoA:carnitine CoA-transferase CaiB-like acyl-CoA transferase